MKNFSAVGHSIRWHRRGGEEKDDFTTPDPLAAFCLSLVSFLGDDLLCDPFRGGGAFYRHMPKGSTWYEIKNGRDFFVSTKRVDWFVSNPPYSRTDEVLAHSARLADKGFGYLLAVHALTPRRIETMEKAGFGLSRIHLCKVFKWYGMNAFCVWQRGVPSIIGYDRIVWREPKKRKRDGAGEKGGEGR